MNSRKGIMGSNSTVIEKVISFVKTGIDQNKWNDGDRLPATRVLARLIHVNIHTLGKALKILANEQLITIIPGQGIFAGAPCTHQKLKTVTVPTTRDCLWRRVEARLEHDLFTREFAAGELPQKNVLLKRYGICYQTLRTVCDSLVKKGTLIRNKTRYRIAVQISVDSSTSVLSISNSTLETVSQYNHFIQNGIAALELLCSRHNLNLVKKGTCSANIGIPIMEHLDHASYFGYIVWTLGIEKSLLIRILTQLEKTKKPVAIISEGADFVMPPFFLNTHLFKIFVPANFHAGKMAGKLLLKHGHRKCAFISSVESASWSTDRLAGIVQSFTDAGVASGVVPITCAPESYTHTDRNLYLQEISEGIFDRFPSIAWWYGPIIGGALMTGIGDNDHQYNNILIGNVFKKALAHGDITAWVCVNDFIAISALQFFKTVATAPMHPSLPHPGISVVGFDDIALSTEHNLTSYNFMPSVVIENALSHIIRPNQEFFVGKTTIECEGLLIERGSTGRA